VVRHALFVSLPFPEPAIAVPSRAEVFLGYLDYFRSRLVSKLEAMPGGELRRSRLPSGWTPIELLKHVAHDELRWLEWRFEGRPVADPWGEDRDGRWYVAAGETLEELVAALHAQAARSRAVVESHDLADIGQPGDGWDTAGPAALERVLFHLVGVIPRSPPAHGLPAGRRQRSGKRLTARSGTDKCQYRAVGFHAGGTVRTAKSEVSCRQPDHAGVAAQANPS